jgi:glycosyltransferase involved in cell wall biosynthesis
MPDRGATPAETTPSILMLGYGWFPDRLGGLNRYYRDLLEHLPEARGVVVGGDASTPARVAGVSGHDRPLPLRLLGVWRAGQQAAGDADVVDAHFALYALAPLLVGRLRHRPLIVHFHGPWADETVAAGEASRLAHWVRRRWERTVYRRADQLVVLTSAFRRVLVERYGVAPWRIHVVPPGVDLERFSPGSPAAARAGLSLPSDAFVAVCVRRLVPRMGVEVLIDAWTDVQPELPEGSTLVIAGDGPLLESLRAAAPHSVRLAGRVSDDELIELYRAADVAVVPSLEHEGFGLVVTEAAACGTPSIVSNVGGLPEAISGLDPSLIVAPGDRQALRARLIRARHDRPTATAARAFAETFNWADVADRHRAIARRSAEAPARPGEDRRFKIVYLDHVAQLSGGEIALLRLLPHLDQVDAHVILAQDGPLVERMNLAGISTEVLAFEEDARDLRKDAVHGRGLPLGVASATAAYVVRLAARLRALRPDIVHTNSLKAGLYGSLAARLAGVPMIWHVRDRIADDYLPPAAVRLVRFMVRRFATAVVANSQSTLQTLAGPRNPVVLYSVLPEVLTDVPARPRATNGSLTFGVVGRLAPWKGQDFFLRSFARAFPDGPERAIVIGGALFGENAYADGLPDLASSLGIAERVELRGHRPDVWAELSQLDVLVHASLTPEPFGQVILEGMAAGVPVVAAGAGGPAEILEHDVTGVLYEPANVDQLAAALRRMEDRELRERLAVAARGSLAPYSPDVVATQLQHLYAAVVERRVRRTGRGR